MSERNWQIELTASIDGELSDADQAALEVAMQQDPQLKAAEQRLRQTIALMAKVPAPVPSPALKRSVLGALEEAAPQRWFSFPRLLPAAALALAALLVVVLTGRDEPNLAVVEEEQVALAQHLELVEDLDLAGLSSPEDLEVIEQLEQLEPTP